MIDARRYHVDHVSAEPLLTRLEGVRKYGHGWTARCPAHEDRTASLSITETPDKVLVCCFAGCRTEDVLAAVGMTFANLFPPRQRPANPAEYRQQRRVNREHEWAAAVEALRREATIVKIAARDMVDGRELEWDDYCRLVKAQQLIEHAASVLVEARA